ncbi:binding-protein-dependent transport system inner membrane protein [Halodesulfurarchaeum formicicum]|uniref:Binding-protein-dependent transport system inner membrane protein n=1 Tax=Halodesulfurarchaeum formicicum TaxID=1873524 RepID=A0A1D8S5U9_9EURY|nr:ABC transporter permease [Halodesulfurarchaeum formicicum]AOW80722.1 binding-protein-dependent transport system inner membrane protein [Halodesulfurarchaeum formicicum]APE96059.1 binding-protein-dependent transport system innermembrane protein [Halodesulfurarchaeum formicicum]
MVGPKLTRTLSLALPIVLWQGAVSAGLLDPTFVPPPIEIGQRTLHLLTEANFRGHVYATLRRTGLAAGSSALFGIPIGFAMAANKRIRAVLSPVISAIFALPVIALFPLLILVMGSTEAALVFTGAVGSFILIVWNARNGAKAIDPVYLEVARDNGARSRLAQLREVWLPGALPLVFVGLRLGLSMSLLIVTAVEFVAGTDGLGYVLWISWQASVLPDLYATLVVIGAIGVLVTDGLATLRTRLIPWDRMGDHTIINP